jgi:hypothetical protein
VELRQYPFTYRQLIPVSEEAFLGEQVTDARTTALVRTMLDLAKIAFQRRALTLVLSGFVADLCEGRLLRPHDDLDLAVDALQMDVFQRELQSQGYETRFFRSKAPEHAFTAIKGNLHVDIGGIQISTDQVCDESDPNGKFIWPISPSELIWSRNIAGIPVRFASPVIVHYFKAHSGRNAAKDYLDLTVLSKHIGIKKQRRAA